MAPTKMSSIFDCYRTCYIWAYKHQAELVVAKSNMTCEPDTINLFINKLWVEVKRVRVIFGLTWLTRLIKQVVFVFNMWTCLTHLTYKVIIYFDIIASSMVFIFYFFINIYVYYYIYSHNCILILDIWELIKIIYVRYDLYMGHLYWPLHGLLIKRIEHVGLGRPV